MVALTLSDGSNTINILSSNPEIMGYDVRVAEKEIPFRTTNIFQFQERRSRKWTFGGYLFASDGSTTILGYLEQWFMNGQGIKTGTLTYRNINDAAFTVFISSLKFERVVGAPVNTFIYELELTERV